MMTQTSVFSLSLTHANVCTLVYSFTVLELSITETQLCVSVEANTVRLAPAVVRRKTSSLRSQSPVWPLITYEPMKLLPLSSVIPLPQFMPYALVTYLPFVILIVLSRQEKEKILYII